MTSLKRHIRSVTSAPRIGDDSGVTLLVTLLVMMLLAALMAGFFAAVNSDMRSNALDKDSTRAYAAAHAGLEKLTSDLAQLFGSDVNPSVADINALLLNPPVIPGFTFTAPGGSAGSGYSVTWKPDVNGNPAPDDPTGSNITAGPYKGFKGIITKYPITITARSTSGGSEMRLRREVQTVAVPVFQFGVFSDSDLTFYAGDNFNFGGRVHTNGNLFLSELTTFTLTFTDKITAVGEVVRGNFSNGLSVASNFFTGNVNVPVTIGTPGTNRNLNYSPNEGSVLGNPGVGQVPNPNWTVISTSTYKSNIRNTLTGAKKLTLPIVSQGATPRDLIFRPAPNDDTVNVNIYPQRYYTQASLRILLSDRAADITALPGVTATAPVALDTLVAGTPAGYVPVTPIARSPGPLPAGTTLNGNPTGVAPAMVFKVTPAVPAAFLIPTLTAGAATATCTGKTSNTFTGCTVSAAIASGSALTATVIISASYQYTVNTAVTTAAVVAGACPLACKTITVGANQTLPYSRNAFWVNGTAAAPAAPNAALVSCTGYQDFLLPLPVTHQFIGCSYSGPAVPVSGDTITTNALATLDTGLQGGFIKIEKQNAAGAWSDVTTEILNLGFAAPNSEGTVCADPTPNAVIRFQHLRDNGGFCDYAGSLNPYDYWPNALYDSREGNYREVLTSTGMNIGGVMNYVALDAGNLKRWLAGTIGTTGNLAVDNAGYIVYFSDRRGNHNAGAPTAFAETSEYGFEDVVNPASATGTPNGALDVGEDVNGNGTLETYGQSPAACCAIVPAGATAPLDATARPWLSFTNPGGNPGQARVNKQLLFRRALKLINAGINAGVSSLPTDGLTVVAENPVYVQGNWNATATNANADPHVPSAIIADAVTLLSNSWKDSNSFEYPNQAISRQAGNTGYRFAVVAGKGLSFPWPAAGAPQFLFGTDGGVGNFLRLLEDWNQAGAVTISYRGSIVSLYTSRQATGTFRYSLNVYDYGVRNFNFDTDFLLPSKLPPGTPMFRDVNTLTFRQILRPTQ